MLDVQDFEACRAAVEAFDEQRETVLKTCRDSQKLAKQAIFSLHRGDVGRAQQQLADTEKIVQALMPIITEHPLLRIGAFSATMEEYAEAMVFLTFLLDGRLLRASELPSCSPEEYLGGVLDFTGELNRYATKRATSRDVAAVQRACTLCEAIMGEMVQFSLRNSSLRKKLDVCNYTLKKLENTLYELSRTERLGVRARLGSPAQEEGEEERPAEQP